MFTRRFADYRANRYRSKGLDSSQLHLVHFLESVGIEGRTVLEIGGGVGELQLDLLSRGAATATNVELVRSYDAPAAALAEETGLSQQVHRLIGDVAVEPDLVAPADLVVLHRVVCCYPDVEGLLSAAGRLTRRALVLSHPPYSVAARGATGLINLGQRVMGRQYRAFDHDPELMTAVLREQGLTVSHRRRGLVWQVVGAVRA
ncbi:SAM-dependent methyltransferase [Ornithinimicrobium cavernae]|uniref:SAM-dependent methyltransferase n=1 Tax=Ornithinimicrobium cavernae TaxID=2666047 RepID=UPI000D68D5D8|nr:SAM-dependent methyltransferase [Ornithinimicrobium cavernae]